MGVVLYGTIALLPLFLQTLMGYPAVTSGMAVSPRGFGAVTSMLIVGRLINRVRGRYLIMFGFSVLAYSIYLFSKINLEISISSIVWPNIISGFAMGFVFVPLTTMALGTLSNEQMGNASGVFNLMRNTGGSVGIATVTTLLARGAQVHQAALVSHLTPYDPVFQERLKQMSGAFAARGGAAIATQQAYGGLYGILVRQATLLSYIDIFRVLSFLCVLCIPATLLFERVKKKTGAVAMH
jgi:DHA2 family multidrug resistance protein